MQTVPLGAGGAIPRPLFHARRRAASIAAALCAAGWLFAVAPVARADSDASTQTGHASWYGEEFASRVTASGERFDPGKLTGAHRTFPLGAKVRVTNLRNGRSVLVTINDRGPYMRRRAIDLSYGAARALGMLRQRIAPVRIELVES